MAQLFDKLKNRKPVSKSSTASCCAIICAAGESRRMGSDKLMLELGSKTVLCRSIEAFQSCKYISSIVVVTRADMLERVSGICAANKYSKVVAVVAGGADRMGSVRCGLAVAPDGTELVAVHDGARPLVSDRVISDAVCYAERFGTAVPAVAVKDTIKTFEKNAATGTPDRSKLKACQTPQVFQRQILSAAISDATANGVEVTDDAQAVQHLGIPVYFTEGDEANIKITTPLDIVIAEAILRWEK